jgi:sugar (pentulose or hexulose) kinase
MGHLLAIDAGTGGCRAVVFSDEGRPLAGAGRRWTHAVDPDQPGSVDFDTRAAWALISECVRDSLADVRAGDVRAVSATSVRGGFVLFDAAGDELWACGSTDARAADQVRSVRERDPGFEAETYRSSGQTLAMAALPRLLWLRDRLPRVYEAASTLGMISDWILARLSGEHAADPANACTTGLFSLARRTWAPELAGRWGLRTDLLPPVVEPGTPIGVVGVGAAEATGLAAGTRVVMGGGDAQVAALGLGVVRAARGPSSAAPTGSSSSTSTGRPSTRRAGFGRPATCSAGSGRPRRSRSAPGRWCAGSSTRSARRRPPPAMPSRPWPSRRGGSRPAPTVCSRSAPTPLTTHAGGTRPRRC